MSLQRFETNTCRRRVQNVIATPTVRIARAPQAAPPAGNRRFGGTYRLQPETLGSHQTTRRKTLHTQRRENKKFKINNVCTSHAVTLWNNGFVKRMVWLLWIRCARYLPCCLLLHILNRITATPPCSVASYRKVQIDYTSLPSDLPYEISLIRRFVMKRTIRT